MKFELPKIISDPKSHSAIGIITVLINQILMYKNSGVPLKKIYLELHRLEYINVKESTFYTLLKRASKKNIDETKIENYEPTPKINLDNFIQNKNNSEIKLNNETTFQKLDKIRNTPVDLEYLSRISKQKKD
jgi:hypothetical protein